MRKQVLYLTYDGLTDPLGRSQILPYLQGLTKHGFDYTIISFEKEERFEKGRAEIEKICAEHGFNWQPLTYTKTPPVLSTVWDVYRLHKLVHQLHCEKNFSIVHCRSYITSLAGLNLKRKCGVKFIFDMRGFYADERVDGNIWNLRNPLFKRVYNYFKRKEKQFIENADYTISLTENGKQEIQSWKEIKGQPVPIQVIPCCADLDRFSQAKVDASLLKELIQKLNIAESDFVISYLGSVGTWYLLDEMLDFFKVLLESKPNAKFLFITADSQQEIITKANERNIPAAKIVITPAPYTQVATYLALCNLSIFFIKPVFSKKASSPTKQGEIMGMGIPLICNANVGDTDKIVEETGCGVVINQFTAEEYRAVTGQLDAVLNIDKAKIIAGAEKYYSLQNGIKNYLSVYQQILN